MKTYRLNSAAVEPQNSAPATTRSPGSLQPPAGGAAFAPSALKVEYVFMCSRSHSRRTERRKTSRAGVAGRNADGDADPKTNEPLTAGPRALEAPDRWPARFTSRKEKKMKPET